MIERIERNKKLYEKYGSWVLLHSPWTEQLPDGEAKFHYSVYDELPSGWAKAFGMDMIEDLGDAIDDAGLREKYYTTQIKEKYGSLRWYDNGTTERMSRIITKYEVISAHTCIHCGRPDVGQTDGWINPLCEKCYTEFCRIQDEKVAHKEYIEEVGPYNYIEKQKGKDYYIFFNRIPNDFTVRQYGLDCSYDKVYDIRETADLIRRRWNYTHPNDTTPLSNNFIIPPLSQKEEKKKKGKIKI